jgi:hypothetical protein
MESEMNTTDLKDKLSATAGKAKEAATSALELAGDAGRSVKEEVKAHAAETVETVRQAAGERASAARDGLVDSGDNLAETLKRQAEEAEGVSARVLNGLASGVTSVTDSLRGRTIGELVASAQDYARRNPGTFAVGAAVAGFALARFLRSSGARASAEARAADTTDRIYRDAARRTVETMGQPRDGGTRA